MPDDDYAGVLERHLPAGRAGAGAGPAGDHRPARSSASTTGYARYTIGQRKGLPGGSAEPRFVVAIRPERREVVIGTAEELAGHRLRLEELNWLADPLDAGRRAARCRSATGPARCPPRCSRVNRTEALELALGDAGTGDHAGPVGRAVWRSAAACWAAGSSPA